MNGLERKLYEKYGSSLIHPVEASKIVNKELGTSENGPFSVLFDCPMTVGKLMNEIEEKRRNFLFQETDMLFGNEREKVSEGESDYERVCEGESDYENTGESDYERKKSDYERGNTGKSDLVKGSKENLNFDYEEKYSYEGSGTWTGESRDVNEGSRNAERMEGTRNANEGMEGTRNAEEAARKKKREEANLKEKVLNAFLEYESRTYAKKRSFPVYSLATVVFCSLFVYFSYTPHPY